MRNSVIVAAALWGLAALAPAQITQGKGGYLMRVNFQKGARYKYDMTSLLKSGKKTEKISMPLTQTVVSYVNRVASIIMKMGPMTLNGKKSGDILTSQMDVDTRNNVVGGNGSALGAVLPDNPVKVGDIFQAVMPLTNTLPGVSRLQATYTFKGMKTIEGKRVAQLDLALKAAKEQPGGHGTIYMLAKDGTLFKGSVILDFSKTKGEMPYDSATVYIHRK